MCHWISTRIGSVNFSTADDKMTVSFARHGRHAISKLSTTTTSNPITICYILNPHPHVMSIAVLRVSFCRPCTADATREQDFPNSASSTVAGDCFMSILPTRWTSIRLSSLPAQRRIFCHRCRELRSQSTTKVCLTAFSQSTSDVRFGVSAPPLPG